MNHHNGHRSTRYEFLEVATDIRREAGNANTNQFGSCFGQCLGKAQRFGNGRTVDATDDELATVEILTNSSYNF